MTSEGALLHRPSSEMDESERASQIKLLIIRQKSFLLIGVEPRS
jgi:hypothetical protein